MKIVNLKAQNIKKLVAVEITPKGDVIQITGKNGNGKSSILDAIWYALGGTSEIPGKPIRHGEDKASIELDLGDLVVKRRFTSKASTLTVENKDGMMYKSPQSILNELVGRLAFDPMEFMRLKPSEQFRELAEHAGLDFDELDLKRKKTFQDRTDINRELKQARAELNAIDVPEGAPDEIVESSSILAEITDANANNIKLAERIRDRATMNDKSQDLIKYMDDLTEKYNRLQSEAEQLRLNIEAEDKLIESLIHIDVIPLQQKLESLEQRNNDARALALHTAKDQQVKRLESDSEKLTNQIESIDQDRLDLIKNAELPVDGIGFGEDVVTYNDIPLDQASSAEQLRVSVSVAMAVNPKLRVLRISDGSLLDSDSLKIIEDMAKDEDFQFWVERVDESGKVGIVIEDGQVKSVN